MISQNDIAAPGDGDGHSAKPHDAATNGNTDNHFRSSGEYDATAATTIAVAVGQREIDGAAQHSTIFPFLSGRIGRRG